MTDMALSRPCLTSAPYRTSSLNLLLIDNRPTVSAGLRLLLRDAAPDISVTVLTDISGHWEDVTLKAPDSILIDSGTLGGNLLPFVAYLGHSLPNSPRLVVLRDYSKKLAVRLTTFQACTLLPPTLDLATLIALVRPGSLSPALLRPDLVEFVLGAGQPCQIRNSAPWHRLTERERQVLVLLSTDRTAAEMAVMLQLTRRTIESHVRRIYQKLGVHSRVEALAVTSPLDDDNHG